MANINQPPRAVSGNCIKMVLCNGWLTTDNQSELKHMLILKLCMFGEIKNI